jgi:hypothetical protein
VPEYCAPQTANRWWRHAKPNRTHVKLLALEDVTVGTARLARAGSDDGEETTGLELLLEDGVDLGVLLALVEDALDVVGLLLVGRLLGKLAAAEGGLGVLRGSAGCTPLDWSWITHVRLVPLPEGSGVDVDNARLDEGLGSQKLVVGSVVALRESARRRQEGPIYRRLHRISCSVLGPPLLMSLGTM